MILVRFARSARAQPISEETSGPYVAGCKVLPLKRSGSFRQSPQQPPIPEQSPSQKAARWELLGSVLELRQHFETFLCAARQHELFVQKF